MHDVLLEMMRRHPICVYVILVSSEHEKKGNTIIQCCVMCMWYMADVNHHEYVYVVNIFVLSYERHDDRIQRCKLLINFVTAKKN